MLNAKTRSPRDITRKQASQAALNFSEAARTSALLRIGPNRPNIYVFACDSRIGVLAYFSYGSDANPREDISMECSLLVELNSSKARDRLRHCFVRCRLRGTTYSAADGKAG